MPSNQTQNYSLNQWSKDDQILMEDFNADNAKIDAALKTQADALSTAAATIPKVAAGSYTGDGAETRTIPLPFTPKAVYVCVDHGATYFHDSGTTSHYYGGLAVTGASILVAGHTVLEIVSGGFKVGCHVNSGTWNIAANRKDSQYHYIAFG